MQKILLAFVAIFFLLFVLPNVAESQTLACVQNDITKCTIRDISAECLAGTKCTADEALLASNLSTKCQFGGPTDCPQELVTALKGVCKTTGKYCNRIAEIEKSAKEAPNRPDPASCASPGAVFSPICWGRTIGVVVGNFLIASTAWLLAVTGLVFNWLVDHTVVQFGSLYGIAKSGIELAWTVFRDIANILIIGLFTFIAISIIIGQQQFGQKKMIARVLIVAVLINFSLLFTKIIIDASNFVAMQFYKAAALPASSGAVTGVGFTEYSQSGISGRFINLMGLTGFADTYNTLTKASYGTSEKKFADANGLRTFTHALFSATVLFAAFLALAYGVFLLASRAVMLIFLMLTSALAFASYLVPQLSTEGSGEQYGWKAWWNALFRAALFGPLLMMFLWATLTIGEALKVTNGTLGDLIANPTKSTNLAAVFSYLIILGLLVASIRLASSFSTTIGGFNFAQAVFSTPMAAALRGFAPLLRQTRGRGGAERAAKLGVEAQEEFERQRSLRPADRDFGKFAQLMRQKGRAEKTAKATFDPMNAKAMQVLAEATGVPAFLRRESKTNFADSEKEKAKRAAAAAAGLGISKKDAEEIARKELVAQQQPERQQIETDRDTAIKEYNRLDAIAKQTETLEKLPERMEEAQLRVVEAQKKKTELDGQHGEVIKEIERRVDTAPDETARTQHMADLARARAAREQELNEQQERIKSAQASYQTLKSRQDNVRAPALKQADEVDKFRKQLDGLDSGLNSQVNTRAREIVDEGQDAAAEAGATAAQSWYLRALGVPLSKSTVKGTRSLLKKQKEAKPILERRKAEDEALREAGLAEESSPAPSTPSAPAPARAPRAPTPPPQPNHPGNTTIH